MESSEPPHGFWNALRQRKLVQWALAYLAGGWIALQVLGLMAESYDWPHGIMRLAFAAIAVGFAVTLVLAWYHGERGQQRVTRNELLILAAVLAIGGGVLWRVERGLQAENAARANAGVHPSAATATIDPKSIAVLPFVNMSGDAKQDYFSDGITEEILDALAQVPDLKVAARTSAFAFKGKAEDLRAVGETLGVATVLEGSVQRSGDTVRITAQLIDARSGFHRWSAKYDRSATDVFAVEDEISRAIADKLQAQLNGGKPLVGAGTGDAHAHDLYLRGMGLLAARGPGLRDAAENFQQAVAIDPMYAQAWAGLAQAQALIWNWHYDTEGTAQPRALAAAQRALEIDPDTAAAYVALGIVHDDQWKWADADHDFRRALELAPGDAEAIDQHAQFLLATGQLQPALAEIERANRLDPYSGIIGSIHAQILLALHRCDDAAAQIARTLAVAPHGRHQNGVALYVALNCKRYDDDVPLKARRFADAYGHDPELLVKMVQGVIEPARRAAALQLARRGVVPEQQRWGWERAYWLALLGDRDGALVALEADFANGPVGGAERLWLPAFDPIRDEPRFKAVLAKIGIPYPPASAAAKPR